MTYRYFKAQKEKYLELIYSLNYLIHCPDSDIRAVK